MRWLELLFPQKVHPDYRRQLSRAVYGVEVDVHIDPLCKDAANLIERMRQSQEDDFEPMDIMNSIAVTAASRRRDAQ